MNWLAVIAKLDDIVEKRRKIVEQFSPRDDYRIMVDQSTQVIQAISEALKEGARTPVPATPGAVEKARGYDR